MLEPAPRTPDGGRREGRDEAGRPGPEGESAPRRRIQSQALFQGGRELIIVHTGKEYVLRITRQGKLILTA
jgi:hemin uptake protein HemP